MQVALLRQAVASGDKGLADSFKQFVLPDNAHTPMATSFLEAYSNHTSQVNLKRGFDSVRPPPLPGSAHPHLVPLQPDPSAPACLRVWLIIQVGGMVTNIPTGDPEVDGKAQAKLRVDKTNEAWKGDAGGWSGHPAFSVYVRCVPAAC